MEERNSDAANLKAEYDRASEVKAFDETKSGVKGLVDGGITQIPRFFHKTILCDGSTPNPRESHFSVPVVDLRGLDGDPFERREIVDRVREASENGGFFQIVNHCIPESVMEALQQI